MKWSPDNRRLALMAKEPGKPWKIYLIDSEGGKLTPLLDEDRNEADPDWSPDGQSIVFGRLPDRMDSRQPKAIYLLNLQTRKVTEIPGSTASSLRAFLPTAVTSPPCASTRKPSCSLTACKPLDHPHHPRRWRSRLGARWPFALLSGFSEKGKPIYRIDVPNGEPQPVASIATCFPPPPPTTASSASPPATCP